MAHLKTILKDFDEGSLPYEFIITLSLLADSRILFEENKQKNLAKQEISFYEFVNTTSDARFYSSNESNMLEKYCIRQLQDLKILSKKGEINYSDPLLIFLYNHLVPFLENKEKESCIQKYILFRKNDDLYRLDISFWTLCVESEVFKDKIDKLFVFSGLVSKIDYYKLSKKEINKIIK